MDMLSLYQALLHSFQESEGDLSAFDVLRNKCSDDEAAGFTNVNFEDPETLPKLEARFPILLYDAPRVITLREDIAKYPYNKIISWTIPSRKMITLIAEAVGEKTLVDVGAGSGLISWLLRRANVRAIPIDINRAGFDRPSRVFLEPEIVSVDYRVPADAVLFISWGRDSMRYYIDNYVADGGKCVIIIGETAGGRTLPCDYLSGKSGWNHWIVGIPNFKWIYTYMVIHTRVNVF